MKYLIFGSSGFLGKSLVRFLRDKGEDVIAVQRHNAEKYNVDITSADSFEALNDIQNVDIFINCASLLPDGTRKINDVQILNSYYQTNVIGAINILNFAALKNINKIINCSTLVVNKKPWPVPLSEDFVSYPTGIHVGYASSKLMQEIMMNEIASALGLNVMHLRISALYGSQMKWQGILPQLIDKAIKGEKVVLTNANKVSFDFLLVDDLVNIIYNFSKQDHWQHKIINAGSGEENFLEELAEKVIRLSNSNAEIEYVESEQQISRAKINIALLKKSLGSDFKFTSIDDGLNMLIKERAN